MFHRTRRNGSFVYDADIDVLRELAGPRGYAAIDLGEEFMEYEVNTRSRLDSYPVDTHWNALAQRVVADRLTPVIHEILQK